MSLSSLFELGRFLCRFFAALGPVRVESVWDGSFLPDFGVGSGSWAMDGDGDWDWPSREFFAVLAVRLAVVVSFGVFRFLCSELLDGAFLELVSVSVGLEGVPAGDESMESWSCASSSKDITFGSRGGAELVVLAVVPRVLVDVAWRGGLVGVSALSRAAVWSPRCFWRKLFVCFLVRSKSS